MPPGRPDSSKTPRVEVLCVGTELLTGKVNTHIGWLARALGAVGLSISRESCLSDNIAEIRSAASEGLSRADVLLVTGGLGPTFDDLTREGVAAALGRPLEFKPRIFRTIQARFRRYGHRRIPEENKRQACLIGGARVLKNPNGSAPGQLLETGGKTIVLLPGPPSELYPMFRDLALPFIKRRYAPKTASRRAVLHLCGVSESAADERLAPLYAKAGASAGLEFTILSEPGLVDLQITATGAGGAQAGRRLAVACREARRLVGKHIFGANEDTLESVVGDRLRRRRLRLAVAESCTGGLLAERITKTPGSSAYFLGGAVCYADEAKERELSVPAALLSRHGAVSGPCAEAMAEGVRRRWDADIAVSITGIAGPGGGTRSKPVGLTFIGLARRERPSKVRRLRLHGGREQVRRRASTAALTFLLDAIQAPPPLRHA